MHILGLANGSLGGNSEILLKAALTAAQESDPSITTSWIHAPSVSVPRNPKALEGTIDISGGVITSIGVGTGHTVPDDRQDVLNAILEADAVIIGTPVYSHQPPGMLKALIDRIMGPFTDASFVRRVLEAEKSGDKTFEGMKFDARILKPRVVGFIAVAGSTVPDQITMALPTLHQLVYSLHMKVVDQYVFKGYGSPGSVLLNGGVAVERAKKLGQNVLSQIGKQFDDAEYLGPDAKGNCPYCHLAKLELDYTKENDVGCITCGARGKLTVEEDGVIRPVWAPDSNVSCITMAGKTKHLDDVHSTFRVEASQLPSVVEEKLKWDSVEIAKVHLKSHI